MDAKRAREASLRAVPAVQRLLEAPALRDAQRQWGREAVVAAAREVLEAARRRILKGEGDGAAPLEPTALAQQVLARTKRRCAGGVRRVINATGVILHTGLGRAVLPEAALKGIAGELAGYASVELDLASGKRGRRDTAVADLLTTLLGCEDATVVNNNAAATLLALAALGRGREVIVSRGQLVEIGGSFRMPDVMAESGAKMVEVGTTNRTYVRDYENAITSESAALVCVHTSNFRLLGFTQEVTIAELAELGRRRGLPVIYDIGSGALFPDLAGELRTEPTVQEALSAGADLVLFSADKVLGGPQGGIAAGRAQLVARLRRHPLYRAFRVDKLILRALESTLALYLDAERRAGTVPVLEMLRRPLEVLRAEAETLAARLRKIGGAWEAHLAEDSSRLGSGSLPERDLPTCVVCLRQRSLSADELAARLRAHSTPIVARIQEDEVRLDPRTLRPGDVEEIVHAASAVKD